jgi:hypothetical protein
VGIAPKLQFSANQVSPSALTFIAVTPCRLVDTRGVPAGFNGISPFSGPSLQPSSTVTFPVQSAAEAAADTTPTPCGTIPSIAQAYSFNITVIPKTAGGVAFLSIWPSGASQPAVSTINDGQGQIVANAAIVPAGTPDGGVSVFNSGPATMDLIIDMNGFYAASGDIAGVTAGTDLTGGGTSGTVTLNLDTTKVPTLAGTNTFTGSPNVFTGNVGIGTMTPGSTLDVNGNINFSGSVLSQGSPVLQLPASQYGRNIALGPGALASNTTGYGNTASGFTAMQYNTTGFVNTAIGNEALQYNTTGNINTASGFGALYSNTTGSDNTASGVQALYSNTTGGDNTASGVSALTYNTTGNNNTAVGYEALSLNSTGNSNVAIGYQALGGAPNTGSNNVAIGSQALVGNEYGSNNIAIGDGAGGRNSITDSNNIDIGSLGSSGDSGVVRIGTQGTQISFFVAGVNGATATNSTAAVLIDTTNGQLVVASSSRRYKEDIEDMGEASRDLMRLRPVTFRYKKPFADGSKPIQYGLIAEEVDEVYPDLVAHSADGKI